MLGTGPVLRRSGGGDAEVLQRDCIRRRPDGSGGLAFVPVRHLAQWPPVPEYLLWPSLSPPLPDGDCPERIRLF
jgi:hypothetical protein